MRIVFLGSGAFAIPCFEALLAHGHELAALVTQPDREQGRGRKLAPPPLKRVAEAHGIPVLQPERIRAPGWDERLRGLAPEAQVVVAYGQILPGPVIAVPPLGTVNVHASLLPRLRGAAPIQWAIAEGHAETGVTTMLVDEGLDTGPVLLARPAAIGPRETSAGLEARLAGLGAELLLETLRGLADGSLRPRPQDPALASFAPLLRKEDGHIDWAAPAAVLDRRVRAFTPWPGAAARLDGRALKVREAEPTDLRHEAAPGVVLAVEKDGILVACGGASALRLLSVQPESRRPMSAAAFAAGQRLAAGARFDPLGRDGPT
jgi:methionyl-tRNA formyltransferase